MDIIIWGCNSFSKRLYQLLQHTSVNAIAFIDKSITTFCEKPVYSPSEFKAKNELRTIPIIIAIEHNMARDIPKIDFESIRQFKIKMQEIEGAYGIDSPLFHPAALIDVLKINFSNKIITFGLGSSGNTVYNHILIKISHLLPGFNSVDPSILFFEQICYEYAQVIHGTITDALHAKGAYNLQVAPWKVGMTEFLCLLGAEKKRLSIYSLPTRDHIICRTYGYHEIPSQSYLSQLQSNGFNTFFIIRNPLDVILSLCKKRNVMNHETNELSFPLFCKQVLWATDRLKTFYPMLSQMKILRYEDLIGAPVKKINNIIQGLHVSFSFLILKNQLKQTQGLLSALRNVRSWFRFSFSRTRMAKKIWDEVGFKALPAAPEGHFWKGGSGKWEGYFKPEHLAFMKATGIEEVLEKFGYNDVLANFQKLTSSIPDTEVKKYASKEFIQSLNCPRREQVLDEYGDTFEYLCKIYGENNCAKIAGFTLGCEDKKFLEHVKDAFESQYINKIASAGVFPQFKYFLS